MCTRFHLTGMGKIVGVFVVVAALLGVACGGSTPEGFETKPAPVQEADAGSDVSTVTPEDAGAPAVDSGADAGSSDDAATPEDAGVDSGALEACRAAACQAAQVAHPPFGGEACGTLPTTCGGLPVDCGTCPSSQETCGDDGTTPNQCGYVCSDIYSGDCSEHNAMYPSDPVPTTHAYDGTCGAQPWNARTGCRFITTPGGANRVCCN